MRNRRKAVGDVRLHHPPAAPPALIDEHLQGIVRRPPRAEPEADQSACPLRRPARARSSPRPARSGHEPEESKAASARPAHPAWDITPCARAADDSGLPLSSLASSPSSRSMPYSSTAARVILSMPGAPLLAAHRSPRAPQHIPAADLVIQRVEPPPGIGLGRPVQRMLQGTDRISRDTPARSLRGGTSPPGTHRAPPRQTLRTDEAAALPITGGYVVRPAQPVLRPPPTPTRPAIHFPGSPVIGRHAPATLPQATGPGRASPVPAATIDAFRAPYAGESLTAALPGSSPLPWPSP